MLHSAATFKEETAGWLKGRNNKILVCHNNIHSCETNRENQLAQVHTKTAVKIVCVCVQ